jgi:MYND finger
MKHEVVSTYNMPMVQLAILGLREAPDRAGMRDPSRPSTVLLHRYDNHVGLWLGESQSCTLMVANVLGKPSFLRGLCCFVQMSRGPGAPPMTEELWHSIKVNGGLGAFAQAGRVRWCTACGKIGGTHAAPAMQLCSRCKRVSYCGKDCQTRHWRARHKVRDWRVHVRATTALSCISHMMCSLCLASHADQWPVNDRACLAASLSPRETLPAAQELCADLARTEQRYPLPGEG